MAQNENTGRQQPDAHIFKVSLSREQQITLAAFLPKRYSFQPCILPRMTDEESMRSEPIKITKKKAKKELKDPDYSASYVAPLKELPIIKTQSLQAIPGGEAFMECYLILKKLKKSMYAWPFRVPVDPKSLGIPEYLNIVLEPMDLKTIEDNLKRQQYKHPAEFHRDMYKIFMNSYKFNQKNSDVFSTTSDFEEQYIRVTKEAKDGKLTFQEKKSVKMETPPQQQPPFIVKEEIRSMEHKPKTYTKREKGDKSVVGEEKLKEKDRHLQHFIVKEKEMEKEIKMEAEKAAEKSKDKQKEKEKRLEKKLEKQRRIERDRMKIEQHSQPESKPVDLFRNFQERQEQQHHHQSVSEGQYDAHKDVYSQPRDQKEQLSHSNDPNSKHRGKHTSQGKIRKHKDKNEFSQTLKQIKELKEVNQFENEKNVIVTNIQKKLTDLLKRLNQYQIPKSKSKAAPKPQQEQINYNNFTSITAAEKKKLGERIGLLTDCELRYVVEICFRHKRNKARDQVGQYDIDLDRLDAKVLKQLSNFVASRTKWVRKTSKRDLSQKNVSQAEEIEEEVHNDPSFFDEQAHLDNEDNRLPNIEFGNHQQNPFENNLLDDRQDFAHDIYQQPNFNFSQKELIQVQIGNNSEEPSYQPDEDDEDDLRF